MFIIFFFFPLLLNVTMIRSLFEKQYEVFNDNNFLPWIISQENTGINYFADLFINVKNDISYGLHVWLLSLRFTNFDANKFYSYLNEIDKGTFIYIISWIYSGYFPNLNSKNIQQIIFVNYLKQLSFIDQISITVKLCEFFYNFRTNRNLNEFYYNLYILRQLLDEYINIYGNEYIDIFRNMMDSSHIMEIKAVYFDLLVVRKDFLDISSIPNNYLSILKEINTNYRDKVKEEINKFNDEELLNTLSMDINEMLRNYYNVNTFDLSLIMNEEGEIKYVYVHKSLIFYRCPILRDFINTAVLNKTNIIDVTRWNIDYNTLLDIVNYYYTLIPNMSINSAMLKRMGKLSRPSKIAIYKMASSFGLAELFDPNGTK